MQILDELGEALERESARVRSLRHCLDQMQRLYIEIARRKLIEPTWTPHLELVRMALNYIKEATKV